MTHHPANAALVTAAFVLAAAACAPAAPSPAASAGNPQTSAAQGSQQGRQQPAGQQRGGGRDPRQGGGAQARVTGTVQIVMPEGVWLTSGQNFGLSTQVRVTRAVPKQLSDLRAGEFVSVTGSRNADGVLVASQVALLGDPNRNAQGDQTNQAQPGGQAQNGGAGRFQGGQAGRGGRPQQGATGGGQRRPGPAGDAAAPSDASATPADAARGPQGDRTLPDGTVIATGSVDSMQGSTLSLRTPAGVTAAQLAPQVAITQRELAELKDVKPGMQVDAQLLDGDAVLITIR